MSRFKTGKCLLAQSNYEPTLFSICSRVEIILYSSTHFHRVIHRAPPWRLNPNPWDFAILIDALRPL